MTISPESVIFLCFFFIVVERYAKDLLFPAVEILAGVEIVIRWSSVVLQE